MKAFITLLFIACFVPSNAQTSWKKLDTPTNRKVYSCWFADDNHGIISTLGYPTSPISMFRTDDGGTTWHDINMLTIIGLIQPDSIIEQKYTPQSHIPKGMLLFLYFIHYKNNGISYKETYLVTSYNDGSSWNIMRTPAEPELNTFFRIDSTTLIGVKDSIFKEDPLHYYITYLFYLSTDKGQTWNKTFTMPTLGASTYLMMNLIPKDSSQLIASIENMNAKLTRFYSSNDKGKTWQPIGDKWTYRTINNRGINRSIYAKLYFLYDDVLVFGDSIPHDGMNTWTKIELSDFINCFRCSLPICYGGRYQGKMDYSSDKGFTWQPIPDSLPGTGVLDIAIPSTTVLYAINTDGIMYKSTTGGGLYPSSPNDPYFSMYPNPADQTLHWNVLEGTVVVFDALGRKVLEVPASSMQADISGLAIGVYYLTIRSGGESVTKVFSVMRPSTMRSSRRRS